MPVLTAAVTKQSALAAIVHKGPCVLNIGHFCLQSTVSLNFSSKANFLFVRKAICIALTFLGPCFIQSVYGSHSS